LVLSKQAQKDHAQVAQVDAEDSEKKFGLITL
jgi:hypothetical protein